MVEQVQEKPLGVFGKMIEKFNLLWFIMVLGVGGTSIAGFAFLNYSIPRTPEIKGLLTLAQMEMLAPKMGGLYEAIFGYLKHHIILFGVLHLIALLFIGTLFLLWRVKYPQKYRELRQDNTRNAVTIAPALALGMSFNVLLVNGYVYVPWMQTNMQALMGWALAGWGVLWLYTMAVALRLQKSYLLNGFDVSKMHFGWLLIPFALLMSAVGGSGLAALARDKTVAMMAFFLSMIPFTFAAFLAMVKLVSLFKSQYRTGLSEKVEFLPSFFIVIPIGTLMAITLFRFGHFFEHQFGVQVGKIYFSLVTAGAWAFLMWYMALGLLLLGNYLRNHLFQLKYFDESQWGLICPMVAFSVLGAFVYETTLRHPVVLGLAVLFLILDVAVLVAMMVRQAIKLYGHVEKA